MPRHSFHIIEQRVMEKLRHLKPDLTYHCLEHTIDVLEQSVRIAKEEGVEDEDQLALLKIAALYHDTGFLETYQKHEAKSAEIFLNDAMNYALSQDQKNVVVDLILVTQIPQRPVNLLQSIICDADLDYLGRDDFFTIGDSLRREFLAYNIVSSDDEWFSLQHKFLKSHHYHTRSSQILREPMKQQHFAAL